MIATGTLPSASTINAVAVNINIGMILRSTCVSLNRARVRYTILDQVSPKPKQESYRYRVMF